MLEKRQLMNKNEVVTVTEEDIILLSNTTFKVEELLRELGESVLEQCQIIEGGRIYSITKEQGVFNSRTSFDINTLFSQLQELIQNYKNLEKWCNDGVECEVLTPNKGWRKGKVKIALEFYPESEESPLEDIRQEINKAT